jgi:hypothetical protein
MRTASLLLLLLCCPGCWIWDTTEQSATAGGVLSKPIVHATLSRHEEWALTWGQSKTYRLDVEIDGKWYQTANIREGTELRISPDRKLFAVLDAKDRDWRLYKLGTTEVDGVLPLEQEGDPLEVLTWPVEALYPPPDYSWLLWVVPLAVATLGSAAAFLLWRRLRRKRAVTPAAHHQP